MLENVIFISIMTLYSSFNSSKKKTVKIKNLIIKIKCALILNEKSKNCNYLRKVFENVNKIWPVLLSRL